MFVLGLSAIAALLASSGSAQSFAWRYRYTIGSGSGETEYTVDTCPEKMRIEVTNVQNNLRLGTLKATATATADPDRSTNPTFVTYQAPITCTGNSVYCGTVGDRMCVGVAKVQNTTMNVTDWYVQSNFISGTSPLCPTKDGTIMFGGIKATRVGNCPAGALAAATTSVVAAIAAAVGAAYMVRRDE